MQTLMQTHIAPGSFSGQKLSALPVKGILTINGKNLEAYDIQQTGNSLTVVRSGLPQSGLLRLFTAIIDFFNRRCSFTTRASKLQLEVNRVDRVLKLMKTELPADGLKDYPDVLNSYKKYRTQLETLNTAFNAKNLVLPRESQVKLLEQYHAELSKVIEVAQQPGLKVVADKKQAISPLQRAFIERQEKEQQMLTAHFETFDFDAEHGPSIEQSKELTQLLAGQTARMDLRAADSGASTQCYQALIVKADRLYWQKPFTKAYEKLCDTIRDENQKPEVIGEALAFADAALPDLQRMQKLYDDFLVIKKEVRKNVDGKCFYGADVQAPLNSLIEYFTKESVRLEPEEVEKHFKNVKSMMKNYDNNASTRTIFGKKVHIYNFEERTAEQYARDQRLP